MLSDFFVRALLAGSGLAAVSAPLGCFIVWRRMAYFGDTLAHSALLGVALSFLFGINLTLGVFIVSLLVAGALLLLQRRASLSTDALLGILSHSSLAVGLVLVAFMSWVRIDLMGFLFGDILAVSTTDLAIIFGGGVAILALLIAFWRPLLAATVSPELAEAEGHNPEAAGILLMILMASVVAIAMKLVGVLLITSLLIIPPATARKFARTPEAMAGYAALFGVLAAIGGLGMSRFFDTPSGPSIVVAELALFLLALMLPGARFEVTGRSGEVQHD